MNSELIPKTLRTTDIIWLNVAAIVGLRWVSLAASSGYTSIILWCLALLFFFLPQAVAVITLTRRYPQEGGIYAWTREVMSPAHGFICGWCYWVNNLVYFPNLLVYLAGVSLFLGGSSTGEGDPPVLYALGFSLSLLWLVTILNIIGLRKGRWLSNTGGISTWITGCLLIFLALIWFFKNGATGSFSWQDTWAGLTHSHSLSLWASICFAFAGLELSAILTGEIKNARQAIPRAVIIAGIIICGLYILGTIALLVVLPTTEINIISGFLQSISAVLSQMNLGYLVPIVALLVTVGGIGGLMAWFTGTTRMPFVAGIDNHLPTQFTQLHPRWNTPHRAILLQAVIASFFTLMSFAGATAQEAYIILLDTTLLVYFIPYLYMFLILLLDWNHSRRKIQQISWRDSTVYLAGICGFITTLVAMGFALVPGDSITSVWIFEFKVLGGCLGLVFTGWIFYKRSLR